MRFNDLNYILDAELHPLIAKAENGNIEAQITLAEAFGDGKNAVKSPQIATYFEQQIFNTSEDVLVKLSVLWNLVIRAKEQGDDFLMKNRFNEVINFLQANIPMEEWDFSLFDYMRSFLEQD